MKVSVPKGTRDFSPLEMQRRNYLFSKLRSVFQNFSFDQIETPSFENYSTLMGKYGEEGDRLIFKILNNGEYLKKVGTETLETKDTKTLTPAICDRALRYDLTVPFARYVVQHRNDITFPFKRFQMQPVWRADKPQKGRYREFYQCDADVVGSDSLQYEVELVQLYDTAFSTLGLSTSIRINNRKILAGIAEVAGISDQLIDFTVALDKLDKIGKEGVLKELTERGIPESALEVIEKVLDITGDATSVLSQLSDLFSNSEEGQKGIEELQYIFDQTEVLGLDKSTLELDLTLARGLNYYTGAIFEVVSNEVKLGSIGGGGRYDNLTGIFGLKDVSGVGISFGLDRIYLVLEELNRFPEFRETATQVCFMNFGETEALACMKYIKALRSEGISSELYPKSTKFNKQMKYANTRQIPFVALVGEDELANNTIILKDMDKGEQTAMSLEELIQKLK
ncbi:MAG: histidine--tRNA ligase [Flavobacteriales bacterium]